MSEEKGAEEVPAAEEATTAEMAEKSEDTVEDLRK